MDRNLEHMIDGKKRPNFKSEGERRIAYFLESNSISYQYEQGVLVNPVYGKPRIWYPDFYLPEVTTYIEYYGLVGRENYDKGIKRKEEAYSKAGLVVIPVYPWTFGQDWEGYIMKELERTSLQRYRKLMSKPFWSQKKSNTYRHVPPVHQGYCSRFGKHY